MADLQERRPAERILRTLGIVWGVLSFVITTAFFLGGEWKDWKAVQKKVQALPTRDELGRTIQEEVRKLPPNETVVSFKVSQFDATADAGQQVSSQIGAHRACFLTGSQDENNEKPPNTAAVCRLIYEESGRWRLFVRGATCNAACID